MEANRKEQLVEQITQEIRSRIRQEETSCGCRTEDLRELVQCGAERFGIESGVVRVSGDLAQYIDHTLLKPDGSEAQIRQLCKEASHYRFATVCVNHTRVRLCARRLKGTGLGIWLVAGCPLRAAPGDGTPYEARRAVPADA